MSDTEDTLPPKPWQKPPPEPKGYLTVDDHGVLRVLGTRVPLDSVIAGFRQGQSAEEIHRDYPSLSLEQVYGAIAFCLANKQDVEEYVRRQEDVWAYWRAKTQRDPNPVVERLRAMKAQAGKSP